MSQKLLVTDLDGTLVVKGQAVSQRNREAIRFAAEHGVTVAIATGRMYRAALPIAKTLSLDAPIIAYNGAMIRTVNGEILYQNNLPTEAVTPVVEFCRQQDWHLQLYVNDELFYAVTNELSKIYETNQKVHGTSVGWMGMLSRKENVTKLLCVSPTAEESARRLRLLNDKFGDKLTCMLSHPRYVEMINPAVSKAAAMFWLADKLCIAKENIFAIGDSGNDLPMLQAAHTGIAMGNAAPEIQKAADVVVATCEDDGFARAVYDIVLQQMQKN